MAFAKVLCKYIQNAVYKNYGSDVHHWRPLPVNIQNACF